MKDPLLNYIDENKQDLDAHVPNEKNWEAIQGRINKTKRRNSIGYVLAIAAMLIVGFFIIDYSSGAEDDGIAQFDADVSLIQVFDSNTVDRRNDVNWNDKPLTQKVNIGDQAINNTVVGEGVDGDLTYEWTANGGVTNISDGVTGNEHYYTVHSLDASATYGTTTIDNEEEKSFNINKLEPLSFGTNSVHQGWSNANYTNQNVQYDVDRYYEQYDDFDENEFETPLEQPLSTFGIDVDGAGYSNMRRFVQSGYLPPKDAVKLEEMVNYFNYDLAEPNGDDPFSITTELGKCPWEENHLLMQVALQGEHIDMDENQSNNIVFLLDVSGSMNEADKLPLLKKSLYLLVNEMGTDDRIAIVVYAGAAGLVLPSTSGKYKSKIYDALENLSAGGSTAGGRGIELAYKVANDSRISGGNNRIILATDGDFNVGTSGDDELVKLIEQKRKTGISLSVLGFGTGNLQSSKMEKLADNGNGNYNYIDNILEAKKVLVDELGGTLVTIAKDVKLQLEFNPEHVKNYRLLGYENRVMSAKEFDDDTKDSGDLGAGHSVVALYEIVPTEALNVQAASNLRYQKKMVNNSKGLKEEIAIIKFRYKKPTGNKSKLIEKVVKNNPVITTSDNFKFASAVAEFGMLIRESKYKGNATFDGVLERAKASKGDDEFGYRAEFIQLVERAKLLMLEFYRVSL
ncbi:MAG: Ca-activated chloride channel family protein [Crocinitomix sp.]|jgi:Ca-activated chloride channel family protein